MTTTTTAKAGQLMYAVQDCSRCGGSGSYSWCQRFGDRCFKCQGTGVQLTRAAAKAKAAVEAWKVENLTVPASSVQPGQRVQLMGKWRTVESVDVELTGYHGGGSAGDTSYSTLGRTVIHCRGGHGVQTAAHADVRVMATEDQRLELEAYMDTLPGVYRA